MARFDRLKQSLKNKKEKSALKEDNITKRVRVNVEALKNNDKLQSFRDREAIRISNITITHDLEKEEAEELSYEFCLHDALASGFRLGRE